GRPRLVGGDRSTDLRAPHGEGGRRARAGRGASGRPGLASPPARPRGRGLSSAVHPLMSRRDANRSGLRAAALPVAALLAAAFVGLAACGRDEAGSRSPASPTSTAGTPPASDALGERARPGFVGSETCIACHAEQAAGWQTSQHRAAMAIATRETVLAPFEGVSIPTAGVPVRFFRDGARFFVGGHRLGAQRIDPDATADRDTLRITGTFGVAPLQQYLTDPEPGRIQVLPWAWDVRPASAGGQRWLDLYPETAGNPSDPL